MSILCAGQMKDSSRAIERWKGLKLQSSCQDALGIDGETVELKCKIFQDFHHELFFKRSSKTSREGTSSPRSSRTGSSSCQCSMTLSGTRVVRIVFQMPKSQELRDEILAKTFTCSVRLFALSRNVCLFSISPFLISSELLCFQLSLLLFSVQCSCI